MYDHGVRLMSSESEANGNALALTDAKAYSVCNFQMVADKLAVPKEIFWDLGSALLCRLTSFARTGIFTKSRNSYQLKEKDYMIKNMRLLSMKQFAQIALLGVTIAWGTGCASARHKLTMKSDYQLKPNTCFEVGMVSNASGKEFDIDVEKRFSEALTEKLRNEDMLWKSGGASGLQVRTRITCYEKGNAFYRWLSMPSGATVLSVECDLWEEGRIVGSAEATRRVHAGGLYSIGAWSSIFSDVAKDLVADLRRQANRIKR